MWYRFCVLLFWLLQAPLVSHAQFDQSTARLAMPGDADIPHLKCHDPKDECRNYSREGIEDFIRSSTQFKRAAELGLSIVVNYDYFVVSKQGFVRHTEEKHLHITSYLADVWHFDFTGTFAPDGHLVNGLVILNRRTPPTEDMVRLEPERAKKAEKERLEKLALLEREQKLLSGLYEKAKIEYDLARKNLNKTLIFPVPLEPYIAFFIDGSSSVNSVDDHSGLNFFGNGASSSQDYPFPPSSESEVCACDELASTRGIQ